MRVLHLDIDTLRHDHRGCSGYHRDTSPNIDALAAEGVRFTNVSASDVPCVPSRTALITGTFGIRNGVVDHGGLAADLRPEGRHREFIGRHARSSWAACSHHAGWHTASISNFPLRHSGIRTRPTTPRRSTGTRSPRTRPRRRPLDEARRPGRARTRRPSS